VRKAAEAVLPLAAVPAERLALLGQAKVSQEMLGVLSPREAGVLARNPLALFQLTEGR
jgi:hypothetical protein